MSFVTAQLAPWSTRRLRQWTAGLSLLSALCAPGCGSLENNLEDIARKVKGEPEGVTGPGRQLAAGSYYGLRFDGNNADGAFAVGVELEGDLVIVPFEGGEPCHAAPAAGGGRRFTLAVSRPEEKDRKGEALIPFIGASTDEADRTLRFTDLFCKLADVAVPHSGLPLSSSFTKEPGFLAQTNGGEIWFVDPWSRTKRIVAQNLAPIRGSDLALFAPGTSGEWMWTLEGGKIVARDQALKVVARVGDNVTRMLYSANGSGGPLIAYEVERSIYLVFVDALDSPTLLAADACGQSFSAGVHGREMYYYQPCDDLRLILKELETSKTHEIGTAITRYRILGSRDDGPILLFLTEQTEDADVGTLYAKFGAKKAIKLGNAANIRLSDINGGGDVEVVREWANGSGRLAVGRLGQDLEEVAKGVVHRSSLGIISDFRDGAGTLQQKPNGEVDYVRVLDGVSTAGLKNDSSKERALVMTGYDGERDRGTLTVIQKLLALDLSDNVRPGSYQFTSQLESVTLLSDLQDDGTAILKLGSLETGDTTVVAEGVSESLEVSWPKSGFLYSVPFGKDAGMWFSQAD